MKKYLIILFAGFTALTWSNRAHGQVFYLGLEGSAVYSWFNSPGIDNIVTAEGWGWNAGFFARYGKDVYLQLGFDWTNTFDTVKIEILEFSETDLLKLHKFDFSVKVGWNFVYTPIFKLRVQGGPLIGKAFLFSGNKFEFFSNDFKSPQIGVVGGLGFQFMNFIFDVEYTYHFTDLFRAVDLGGEMIKFNTRLQYISIKLGFML